RQEEETMRTETKLPRSRWCVTRPDPIGAHAQRVAAATRAAPGAPVVALGALVLYLGALALSQIGCTYTPPEPSLGPTSYTCHPSCSRRVTAELGALVLTLPGGSLLDTVPKGSVGSILDGPTDFQSLTWWQVQFDGRPDYGPGRGWVRQDLLTVA